MLRFAQRRNDADLATLHTSSSCDWSQKMLTEIKRKGYAVNVSRDASMSHTPQLCSNTHCIQGFVEVPPEEPDLRAYIDEYCRDSVTAANCTRA